MWIIVALVFSNNVFHGNDLVPTNLMFSSEQACKANIATIVTQTNSSNNNLRCVKLIKDK